jgi:pantetheine-phosphate adenylyltransferase
MFDLQQRIDLCQQALAHLSNIEVYGFNNLLVDFASQHNSDIVLRGVRSIKDFEYEMQLASMNKSMSPEMETVFLTPSANLSHISSTLVREISTMSGDVSQMVPACVLQALKLRKNS